MLIHFSKSKFMMWKSWEKEAMACNNTQIIVQILCNATSLSHNDKKLRTLPVKDREGCTRIFSMRMFSPGNKLTACFQCV